MNQYLSGYWSPHRLPWTRHLSVSWERVSDVSPGGHVLIVVLYNNDFVVIRLCEPYDAISCDYVHQSIDYLWICNAF